MNDGYVSHLVASLFEAPSAPEPGIYDLPLFHSHIFYSFSFSFVSIPYPNSHSNITQILRFLQICESPSFFCPRFPQYAHSFGFSSVFLFLSFLYELSSRLSFTWSCVILVSRRVLDQIQFSPIHLSIHYIIFFPIYRPLPKYLQHQKATRGEEGFWKISQNLNLVRREKMSLINP